MLSESARWRSPTICCNSHVESAKEGGVKPRNDSAPTVSKEATGFLDSSALGGGGGRTDRAGDEVPLLSPSCFFLICRIWARKSFYKQVDATLRAIDNNQH